MILNALKIILPMINNSTLLVIVDDINNESEIIDLNGLQSLENEFTSELNSIFRLVDYSPSDDVIKHILHQI